MHTYTVQRGESARSVAEKFGVSEHVLLRENPAPFYEGQQVTVPVSVLHLPPGPDPARFCQVPEGSVLRRPDRTIVLFGGPPG